MECRNTGLPHALHSNIRYSYHDLLLLFDNTPKIEYKALHI